MVVATKTAGPSCRRQCWPLRAVKCCSNGADRAYSLVYLCLCTLDWLFGFRTVFEDRNDSLSEDHFEIAQKRKFPNRFSAFHFKIVILGLIDAQYSDADVFCKAGEFQKSLALDIRTWLNFSIPFSCVNQAYDFCDSVAEKIPSSLEYCID